MPFSFFALHQCVDGSNILSLISLANYTYPAPITHTYSKWQQQLSEISSSHCEIFFLSLTLPVHFNKQLFPIFYSDPSQF